MDSNEKRDSATFLKIIKITFNLKTAIIRDLKKK